ncbi:hypothetical protein SAMN05421823_11540 [Catalinimonas alkaloidigena]|uniref:Uncharacterized protein n=1 Tax=Catalinimonas alkaloidigena TaxID=1075417 RepID=A0A1G9TZS1_9BACT|nr:hypothetical protein [Catalinimonas alkaloidigena]SDM53043.1 hypothetical protein SAMN05421823_11540 [Catalinimonas alkaloidigena]
MTIDTDLEDKKREEAREKVLHSVYNHFLHFRQHKSLPKGKDVFFCTSVADVGVNVYSQMQAVVIIDDANTLTTDEALQFAARFRKVKNLPVHIWKTGERPLLQVGRTKLAL